jgi:hypothetical protein
MGDDASLQIDAKTLQLLAKAAEEHVARESAESCARLTAALAAVQKKTGAIAERWPEALAKAGLPVDPAYYEKLLRELRSADGRLNISGEMLALGLRFRDALSSLGVDSETLTSVVGLPPEHSYSSGLGSISSWTYVVTQAPEAGKTPESGQ